MVIKFTNQESCRAAFLILLQAFTCTGDSVPYYRMLKRVQAKCPMLEEVKVNMEMFAERLSNGRKG